MNNEGFYKQLLRNNQMSEEMRIKNTIKMLDEQSKMVNMKYLFITKEEVMELNTKKIEDFFSKIDEKYKRNKSKVFLVFDGWDNDRRELYEIKAIVNYVRKFFLDKPHTLFYLSEKMETLQLILSCLGKYTSLKPIDVKTIIEKIKENEHRLSEIQFKELTTRVLVSLKIDESSYSELVFDILKFFDEKDDFNSGYLFIQKINSYIFNKTN